jgi:LemA protein
MKYRTLFVASAGLALTTSLSGCGLNSVPTQEENAKAKWADVENYYQRRADLIPNLVATVKAAGAQEKSILVEVTQARAGANQVKLSADQLNDPAKVAAYEKAQSNVTLSLQRLQENYATLMDQLEGTENRISTARHDYNGAVQSYNTTIRTFPDAIGAKVIYGAKPLVPFKATTPGSDQAPTVNFGNTN